jgi:hypothetical protein
MAITKELSDRIKAAYALFVDMLGDRYLNTQSNCDAIKNLMNQNGYGPEYWQYLGSWTEFHLRASKAGLLTEPSAPEVPKSREQINLEREIRDRAAGYMGGVREVEETPYEEMVRMEQQRKDHAESKARRAAEEATAARAAAAASTDISMIPSVKAILSGEAKSTDHLSPSEMQALSGPQLKAWMQRTTEAKAKIANDRVIEREKRERANR